MVKLRELMGGKAGQHVATILMACEKKGYLMARSYTAPMIIEEFGLVTSSQSINKYLNKGMIPKDEIDQAINMLP